MFFYNTFCNLYINILLQLDYKEILLFCFSTPEGRLLLVFVFLMEHIFLFVLYMGGMLQMQK